MMKVTFLGHSGFYAELPHAAFVFDWYKGELPSPLPGKPLFVFASHVHEDHFDPQIFRLAESGAPVLFILSDDIPEERIPAELMRQTILIGPDTDVTIPIPMGDDLIIRTYRSTDEGVAFLLDLGGTCIYHAGDLNNWHWQEAGPEDRTFNEAQQREYTAAMKKIAADCLAAGRHPDAAFVPLDSRLGEAYWMGLHEFMETVGAEHVFPMHLFGDRSVIGRLKELPCAAGYASRVLGSGVRGEVFTL